MHLLSFDLKNVSPRPLVSSTLRLAGCLLHLGFCLRTWVPRGSPPRERRRPSTRGERRRRPRGQGWPDLTAWYRRARGSDKNISGLRPPPPLIFIFFVQRVHKGGVVGHGGLFARLLQDRMSARGRSDSDPMAGVDDGAEGLDDSQVEVELHARGGGTGFR